MREQALFNAISPLLAQSIACTVLLEGLASGNSPLDQLDSQPLLQLTRLAPACLCCAGNLVLNVHINRCITRSRRQANSQRLFISLADATHLPQLRAQLIAAPWDQHLQLNPDLLLT